MNQEQIMQQLQGAVALHNQGELDKAEEICRKVLAVDANNFYALNFSGCIQRAKKNFDEAINLLTRAVSLQPGNPDAIYNLGNVFKEAERWQEALSCYETTLGLRPENPEALNNLGTCLKEVERYEYSEIVFRRALSIRPDFVGAWFNLGNTFAQQHKCEEAIACYRKSIELNPDFVYSYFALACVLKEKGDLNKAILNYRKSIELNPGFTDAYWELGCLLKEVGKIDEVRQVVKILRQIRPFEKEALVTFQDKALVFDWHHRRALNLLWEVELAAALSGAASCSCLSAAEKIDSLCFPPLFLGRQSSCEQGRLLYEEGYLVDEDLIAPDLCCQLVEQFSGKAAMSVELIESVVVNGILRNVLERIFLHTGFLHLIWNCIYFAKSPSDESVADMWHYDNHFNAWTPKLMIYLNPQRNHGGATHFVNARLSRRISEVSDYLGLVFQRESYSCRVKALVNELNVDPVTLDPDHYSFSPERAGSGVWFCPARSLHRGVSPKKGVRHVLSFSLTPLPVDCGLNIDQCVEKSIYILHDKIKKGMHTATATPYWISAEIGSSFAGGW